MHLKRTNPFFVVFHHLMISSLLECKDLIREFHRGPVVIVLFVFIGLAMNNVLVVFYESPYSLAVAAVCAYILNVLCGDVVYSTDGHVFRASELGAHELAVSCICCLMIGDNCLKKTANVPIVTQIPRESWLQSRLSLVLHPPPPLRVMFFFSLI